MSLIRLSFVVSCSLVLCACAPLKEKLASMTTPPPSAQSASPTEAELIEMAKNMPTEKDIRERFESLSGMYRQICLAPELAPYFDKTPCLPSMIKAAHVNDATRITARQADAMRQAVAEIRELNDETRRIMIDSGLEPYVSQARHASLTLDPLVVANQNALLNGEITWGEYNRRRAELATPPDTAPIETDGSDSAGSASR